MSCRMCEINVLSGEHLRVYSDRISIAVVIARRITLPGTAENVVEGIAAGLTQTVPVKTSDEVVLGRAINQTVESMRITLGLTAETTDKV